MKGGTKQGQEGGNSSYSKKFNIHDDLIEPQLSELMEE
jgi:hypothetical protein